MKFINIHTHRTMAAENELPLFNIFAKDYTGYPLHKGVFYSVGLHPWHIGKGDDLRALEIVEKAASDPMIKALGECGLDRAIETPFNIQMDIFDPQLKYAEESGKPVILHCVRSIPEMISIRKSQRYQVPWIVHGFSGNIDSAKQLLRHGIYISTGKALFRDNSKVPSLIPIIDENMLFLESDDSNLKIEDVYNRAAQLKNVPVEYLRNKIEENFRKVFQV